MVHHALSIDHTKTQSLLRSASRTCSQAKSNPKLAHRSTRRAMSAYQRAPFQLFDGVVAPALPAGWSNNDLIVDSTSWTTVSGGSHTGNNHAFIPNVATTTDNVLLSPVFTPTAPTSRVSSDTRSTPKQTSMAAYWRYRSMPARSPTLWLPWRVHQRWLQRDDQPNFHIHPSGRSTSLDGHFQRLRRYDRSVAGCGPQSKRHPTMAIRFRWECARIGWRVDSIAFEGPITPID